MKSVRIDVLDNNSQLPAALMLLQGLLVFRLSPILLSHYVNFKPPSSGLVKRRINLNVSSFANHDLVNEFNLLPFEYRRVIIQASYYLYVDTLNGKLDLSILGSGLHSAITHCFDKSAKDSVPDPYLTLNNPDSRKFEPSENDISEKQLTKQHPHSEQKPSEKKAELEPVSVEIEQPQYEAVNKLDRDIQTTDEENQNDLPDFSDIPVD